MSDLKQLSDAATQGVWGIDTLASGSHYVGPIKEGSKSLAGVLFRVDAGPDYRDEYNETARANAALIATLVNGYRNGTLVEAQEWQPISTAPREFKDGRRCLGLTPYGVEVVRWTLEHFSEDVDGPHARAYTDGWWGLEGDSTCKPERHDVIRGITDATCQPTYLMAFPKPPEDV